MTRFASLMTRINDAVIEHLSDVQAFYQDEQHAVTVEGIFERRTVDTPAGSLGIATDPMTFTYRTADLMHPKRGGRLYVNGDLWEVASVMDDHGLTALILRRGDA